MTTLIINIKEIIKFQIINNAKNNGWIVVNSNINTFILTKKINKLDESEIHNSDLLIENLLNITKFENIIKY